MKMSTLRKYLLRGFLPVSIGSLLWLAACQKDSQQPAVAVSGFTPAQGAVGATVTIDGNNFSTTAANNMVKFNGTAAMVSAATATSLTVTVSTGATTGKIAVTVGSSTATSTNDFTVLGTPTITSFSPASGIPGTAVVTITGTNFDATAANNTVKFNGTAASVTTATTTSLTMTVPSGATSGKITVTVNGITGTSTDDFTVLSAPSITTFSPASGVASVAVVTINGTNFSATAANNTVKFNGTTASVTNATTTALTVTAPAGATTGKITVTVNGVTATSTNDFTILPAPTVTDFSPISGAPGVTVVTINGTNFDTTPANNVVKFNTTTATVTNATATALTVTVPVGATSGKISVTVNGVTVASATDFTPFTITGISPSSGGIGTVITITGTGFSTSTANDFVGFASSGAVTAATATATQMTFTVGAGTTTGAVLVSINNSGYVSGPTFTVVSVGSNYGGGIVFYVDNTGHGLIAATADQTAPAGAAWATCGGCSLATLNTSVAIGAGQANTTAIVNLLGAGNYPASICDQLVLNGYSDWYLPSQNELDLLNKNAQSVGGFINQWYWSSSLFDATHPYSDYITNGNNTQSTNTLTADESLPVRAIRSF